MQPAEDNKKLAVDALDELLNRGNLDAADRLVHPEFLNHEAAEGRPRGPEGMRQTVSWLHDAFADLHLAVEDVIAEGDKVVVRCIMSGRHTGELMGLPPTGASFSVQHIHTLRLAEGKLVEHWANRDDTYSCRSLGEAARPASRISGRERPADAYRRAGTKPSWGVARSRACSAQRTKSSGGSGLANA